MSILKDHILILNGGSSSIKFAVYTAEAPLKRSLRGHLSRIGRPDAKLTITDAANSQPTVQALDATDYGSVVNLLVAWLEKQPFFNSLSAVGHRVVHGMAHTEPERITPALLDELRMLSDIDPDHLPGEIALMETIQKRHPTLTQVACFDTAFHRTLPRVAQLLPLPRRYDAQGIRRYGFHGLSYAFLLDELGRIAGDEGASGRVILAHLGGGASLCAVRHGQSLDTTMGFTPTGGLMMGTRPGDLDPSLTAYLMQSEALSPAQFTQLINHESGLLGVSETSSDVQDLLTRQLTDVRAAEAIELFCYGIKKGIGAFAAALNGLDTLVFSGGIGEHAPDVRARVCQNMNYLGIDLDAQRNAVNAAVISTDASRVTVRVMATDEEQMIARHVSQLLASSTAPAN